VRKFADPNTVSDEFRKSCSGNRKKFAGFFLKKKKNEGYVANVDNTSSLFFNDLSKRVFRSVQNAELHILKLKALKVLSKNQAKFHLIRVVFTLLLGESLGGGHSIAPKTTSANAASASP